MSVVKLSSIYYLEANDSESSLPKTLALWKCNVGASSSTDPLWTVFETDERMDPTLYLLKKYVVRSTLFCLTLI